jgi:hypothetical protein
MCIFVKQYMLICFSIPTTVNMAMACVLVEEVMVAFLEVVVEAVLAEA